jgi:hypothetical protein
MDREVDIVYSLDLLRKVNAITVQDIPIPQYFNAVSPSAWATKQFFLLSQIKEFSRYKNFSIFSEARRVRDSRGGMIGIFVSRCFIILSSLIAVAVLILRRVSVMTFEADRVRPGTRLSPRLYRIFEILREKHVGYMESVHATSGMNLIRNAWARRRPVLYLEAIDTLYSFLPKQHRKNILVLEQCNLSALNSEEADFVRELLVKTAAAVHESVFRVRVLTHILRNSFVQEFISIDDFRYMHEIIEAARLSGVRSHIFQHSNFDYLMGLDQLSPVSYPFPDRFYTWNAYWCDRIPEISPLFNYYKERLQIGARTYLFEDTYSLKQKDPIQSGDTISVLIPYEISLTASQIRPYIEALTRDTRIEVVLQLRSDVDKDEQIEKYCGSIQGYSTKVHTSTLRDKTAAFERAHVVLGVYSGFLDEALEVCRPVGIFACEYPIFNPLVPLGLAESVAEKCGELYEKLLRIANTPPAELLRRREYVRRGAGDLKETFSSILRKASDIVR